MKTMKQLFWGFLLLGLIGCGGQQPEVKDLQAMKSLFRIERLEGSFQVYRQGRLLAQKDSKRLEVGDLLMVAPKGLVKITLLGKGYLVVGGNGVLLMQPWEKPYYKGLLSLEYGQARLQAGKNELTLRTPFGLVEVHPGGRSRLALSSSLIALHQEKGEARLLTEDEIQALDGGEAATGYGNIYTSEATPKSLGITKNLNSPSRRSLKNPSLWPTAPLIELGLLDLEDLTAYQKMRKNQAVKLQGKNFVRIALGPPKGKLGDSTSDQKPLIEPLKQSLTTRPLGDVAKVIITIEK